MDANTRTIRHKGLTVEIHASTQYATVYRKDGTIAGTVSRRRVLDRNSPVWSIASTDGVVRYSGNMVSSCLSGLARYFEQKAETDAQKAIAAAKAAVRRDANNEPSLDELATRLMALSGEPQYALYEAATRDWTGPQLRALDAACEKAKRKQLVADALPFAVHMWKEGRDTGRVSCPLADRASAEVWIGDWRAAGPRFENDDLRVVDYSETATEE